MANWQLKINVKELWKQGEDRTITVNEFAKRFGEILEENKGKVNRVVTSLDMGRYDSFIDEAKNSEFNDFDDFDNLLDDVYNFFDYYKIWLETF